MTALTMFSFAGVFVLCLMGLFSTRFEDNWLQHVGLIGMGLSSFSGVHRTYQMSWVPPEMALFAFAAFSFACGTALKVWMYRGAPAQRKAHAHKTLRSPTH